MNKKRKLSTGIKVGRSIFTIALVLLCGIAMGLEFLVPKLHTISVPKDDAELGIVSQEKTNLSEEDAKLHNEMSKKVQNILVIGVDEGGYDSGRSDVMIIASLDGNHKKLKLTSVMRDTYSFLPTSESYQKLNHSYMEGGALETMKAINMNLDLGIRDFVIFDFDAVAKAVDYIGGYPVNMDAGEVIDMNNYGTFYEGENLLNGEMATLYMRIRYNSGNDEGRNQRQRDLIVYLLKRAKDMSKGELVNFAKAMMPAVRTSYSFSDVEKLLALFEGMKDGVEMEQFSFPSNYSGVTLYDGLWYAVPNTMKSNVIELHKNIFGFDNYSPSDVVEEINQNIMDRSGVYGE